MVTLNDMALVARRLEHQAGIAADCLLLNDEHGLDCASCAVRECGRFLVKYHNLAVPHPQPAGRNLPYLTYGAWHELLAPPGSSSYKLEQLYSMYVAL